MRTLAKPQLNRKFGVHPARLTLCVMVCLFSCLISPTDCFPQQSSPTEAQVKAAYLYNFSKFVRWQGNSIEGEDSFSVCVLGKNPFGSALSSIVAGETIAGKAIVVKNIAGTQEIGTCGILFVTTYEEFRLKQILAAVRHLPALTVSDIPGFAARGGMIEFLNQGDKIRFEVNVAPLHDAGLTVSSELLKVAVKVIGTGEGAEVRK